MQIGPDLFWKLAFPEWSGWHTDYSLPLALSCSECRSFWKLLIWPPHHSAEPGHWSMHKVFFAEVHSAQVNAVQRTSWKYKPGIIVVSTTAAIRVKFISHIINKEASPKDSLDILFAKITLTFCHFRQCKLNEDFWLLSREAVLCICFLVLSSPFHKKHS